MARQLDSNPQVKLTERVGGLALHPPPPPAPPPTPDPSSPYNPT